MDITTLIASLISGAVAIIVCVLNNASTQRKHDEEQDKKMLEFNANIQQCIAVISCKIDELDRKQTIHNGVIERVYKLEEKTSVQDEKIKVANNRIADLEKAHA